MRYFTSLAVLSLALSGCVNDSDDAANNTADTSVLSASSASYTFTFSTLALSRGVASVQVHVTDKAGNQLPGDEELSISPLMNMVSGMQHGTPLAPASGTLDGEGNFTTHIYYLMASGAEMGTWSMILNYNGEQVVVNPDVQMQVSDVVKLQSNDDVIASASMGSMATAMMMNTTPRTYYIFTQHLENHADEKHLKVFVAAREDMLTHTPVVAGTVFNPDSSYALNVTDVALHICAQDCASDTAWLDLTAVEGEPGVYEFAGDIPGLMMDGELNIALFVNDSEKTAGGVAGAHGVLDFSSAASGAMHAM